MACQESRAFQQWRWKEAVTLWSGCYYQSESGYSESFGGCDWLYNIVCSMHGNEQGRWSHVGSKSGAHISSSTDVASMARYLRSFVSSPGSSSWSRSTGAPQRRTGENRAARTRGYNILVCSSGNYPFWMSWTFTDTSVNSALVSLGPVGLYLVRVSPSCLSGLEASLAYKISLGLMSNTSSQLKSHYTCKISFKVNEYMCLKLRCTKMAFKLERTCFAITEILYSGILCLFFHWFSLTPLMPSLIPSMNHVDLPWSFLGLASHFLFHRKALHWRHSVECWN